MIALATTNGHRVPTPAPSLRLVTSDGEQVEWAWTGRRYVADGSAVRDHDQGRLLPLIEAELRLAKLTHEATMAGPRVGRIIARDAVSLERSIKQCRQPAEPRRGWFGRTGR